MRTHAVKFTKNSNNAVKVVNVLNVFSGSKREPPILDIAFLDE